MPNTIRENCDTLLIVIQRRFRNLNHKGHVAQGISHRPWIGMKHQRFRYRWFDVFTLVVVDEYRRARPSRNVTLDVPYNLRLVDFAQMNAFDLDDGPVS